MSCSNCSTTTSTCTPSTTCSTCNCVTLEPIIVYRGRSFAPIIRLQDSNGIPIDTTPYTEITVSVCAITPPAEVTVRFSLSEVDKVSPNSSGQIRPKFTAANTSAMGLTDPTQASDCKFTPIVVSLTDPTNPDQNPYILVIENALNILDIPCAA